MDFFEAQGRARQRTTWLAVLFGCALVGTILASYAAAVLIVHQASPRARNFESGYWGYQRTATWNEGGALTRWWDPRLFATVAGGVLLVVTGASLVKWLGLRHGGPAVAEMVGGRPILPQTTDLREKRLLNVVEEMAIASGTPMPAVYVLDDEPGINAFAAGLTTNDAVVAVTRGTLEKLSRDELQGVVAHEFSHILNGDMRINVRFTAILFGILVIGLLGRGILYSMGRGRVRTGRGRGKGGGVALILAIGLALLIIGYIGYFFGRMIQAAISRQREFLADASAVQFTRNPGGISGALKKIGGFALGGNLQTAKAAEIGHFFFAQGFRTMFSGIWSTHPPLAERIRAIEPGWDGQLYEPPEAVDISKESFATAGFAGPRLAPDQTLQRVHALEPRLSPAPSVTPIPFRAAAILADVGTLTETHLRQARQLLAGIPVRLHEAAREPSQACAVIYGLLLLGAEPHAREKQLALIARYAGQAALDSLAPLRPALSLLDPAARLPLLQLCEPALRAMDRSSLDRFLTTLDELVHADAHVTPYEFAMQKMLVHHLRLGGQAPASEGPAKSEDIAVALSYLARIGGRDEDAAGRAFQAGAARIQGGANLAMPARQQVTLEQLDGALDRLTGIRIDAKRQLLIAAAHTIGADGFVSVEEGDLFRAIAATLDCPIPPLGSWDPLESTCRHASLSIL